MVADGHVLIVGMDRKGHHAHVGNVVFRPGEGDVEIFFFCLSAGENRGFGAVCSLSPGACLSGEISIKVARTLALCDYSV